MKKKCLFIATLSLLTFCATSCGNMDIKVDVDIDTVVHASQLKLNASSITLYTGETFQIECEILPLGSVETSLTYTVKNPDVCSVSETGLVKANYYNGSTTIRVSLTDNPLVSAEIRVSSRRQVLVTDIDCSLDAINLFAIGESRSFIYTISPLNATEKDVDIYIEDETIAKLNDSKNKVFALANGSTNLVLKSLQSGSDAIKKIPINVNLDNVEEAKVEEELAPTKYFDYNKLNVTQGLDVLPSLAPADDPEKVLVVPVEFSDFTFEDALGSENGDEEIVKDLNIAFNGTSEETNYWESVSSYFKKSSFNNLNFDFNVIDPITSTYTLDTYQSYYYQGYSIITAVILDAFDQIKANQEINMKDYDNDKDGLVDSIWFIYSVPNYANNPWLDGNSDFWAFCTAFTEPEVNLDDPGIDMFGWASYDFMYKQGYNKIDAHTYIHETGHLLGLMDYYNYTYQNSPLGMYDMQDCNIGDHNVWTKAALGRLNPIIIDTSKNIPAKVHLNPREDGGAVFITNSYNNTAFDEFIVLELYTNNGLNELDSKVAYESDYGTLPNGYGVKIYHVDSRLVYQNNNEPNQKYYDLSTLKDEMPSEPLVVGASNTSDYSRNYTSELFSQIELISATGNKGIYQQRFAPYSLVDLFQTGDNFNLKDYSYWTYKQYGRLNSGESLNVNVYFSNVTEEGADLIIDTY